MTIQIHGRKMPTSYIYNFSWIVQDFKSSPAQVRPLSLGRSRLRNLIFYNFLLLVRPNKETSILLKPSENIRTWLVRTCLFHLAKPAEKLVSSHLGAVQFALTNKSTSNIFDTESPSRRIACWLDVRMSMARAGQLASVTAVPLVVMLQD